MGEILAFAVIRYILPFKRYFFFSVCPDFLILKGIIEESAIICTSFLSSMQLIWFKYLFVTNIFPHGLVTIHPRSQGT